MAQNFGDPLPSDVDLEPYRRSMEMVGNQQRKFNNPNTANPWASFQTNPDGTTSTNFTGQFGSLNDALMGQAASAASSPLDFGAWNVSDGSAAGKETAQAAFGQMKSRLDPMWQKSEHNMRRNAFQSGMADGTAMDNAVGEFGRARNDAYSSAMSDALRQGMSAQQSAFGGNLAARQTATANALRQKTQPWEELGQMSGFLGQPDYNKDNSAMVAAAAQNQMADARAIEQGEGNMRSALDGLGTGWDYSKGSYEDLKKMATLLNGGVLPADWEKRVAGGQ